MDKLAAIGPESESEQAFVSDGAILKNAVLEATLKMDLRLLELLSKSETVRKRFFAEVSGMHRLFSLGIADGISKVQQWV